MTNRGSSFWGAYGPRIEDTTGNYRHQQGNGTEIAATMLSSAQGGEITGSRSWFALEEVGFVYLFIRARFIDIGDITIGRGGEAGPDNRPAGNQVADV